MGNGGRKSKSEDGFGCEFGDGVAVRAVRCFFSYMLCGMRRGMSDVSWKSYDMCYQMYLEMLVRSLRRLPTRFSFPLPI